jgi:hypothetical protein
LAITYRWIEGELKKHGRIHASGTVKDGLGANPVLGD